MFFSGRHLSTQIQRSPRIIEFPAELPVEKAAGGGLNHFRIQQDSSICPVFRHAECAPVPSGIQIFIGDGPFPAGGIPDFLRLSGRPVRPCAGDLENAPAASGGRKGKLIRNLPVIHLQELPQSVQAEIFPGFVFSPERIGQIPVILHPDSAGERRIRRLFPAECEGRPRHA